MGFLFGTEEWTQAYIEKLNQNEEYEKAAQNWEGDFIFDVLPDGGLQEELRIYLNLWHGKCRSGRQLQPGEEQTATYTLTGLWSNWALLIDGQLDPLKAIVKGKFKLKGSMMTVMRQVKAAKAMVAIIGMVETDKY